MDEEKERLEVLVFASQMGDLSGKTFKHVYNTNPLFVDFTLKSMSGGKGIFKSWLNYVKIRSVPTHA